MTNHQKTKSTLIELAAEISSLRQQAKDDQSPVTLDQQTVGRLSRMDSLQVQAMDQAKDARRVIELKRIQAALQRIDDDEYGWCVTCGDEIALSRLKNDPAAPFCIACA